MLWFGEEMSPQSPMVKAGCLPVGSGRAVKGQSLGEGSELTENLALKRYLDPSLLSVSRLFYSKHVSSARHFCQNKLPHHTTESIWVE